MQERVRDAVERGEEIDVEELMNEVTENWLMLECSLFCSPTLSFSL